MTTPLQRLPQSAEKRSTNLDDTLKIDSRHYSGGLLEMPRRPVSDTVDACDLAATAVHG
jgi:hypothetical protein